MAQPITIAFDEFVPDQGWFRHEGLIAARNVVPLGPRGFIAGAVPETLTPITGGDAASFIVGPALGAGTLPLSGNAYMVYAAADDKLFEIDPASSWSITDKSRLAGGAYTPIQDEGWQFLSFGENMLATPGISEDPQLLTSGAANFVKLVAGGSPNDPSCKYLAALGLRVLMAHVKEGGTTYPNRVWWSGSNDPTIYGTPSTSPTTRTNFEDLDDDYGEIMGAIGGSDYAYIFKRSCIYRMDHGGPFAFTFKPFGIGIGGTVYPNSICKMGEDVYFWGPAGPSVVYQDKTVRALGHGKVSRSLQDRSWITDQRPISTDVANNVGFVHAQTDPVNNLVYWLYRTSAVVGNGADTLFIYNATYDRGAIQETFVEPEIGDQRVTTDGLERITTDGLFRVLVSNDMTPSALFVRPNTQAEWRPGRDVLFLGTDNVTTNIHVWGWSETDQIFPRFRSGYRTLPDTAGQGQTSRPTRVRPIFSMNDAADGFPFMELRLYTKQRPWDEEPNPYVVQSDSHLDSQGALVLTENVLGSLHSFELVMGEVSGTSVAAQVAEIEGLEVEYESGGTFAL